MSVIHLPIYIHVSTLCFPCYYMVTTGSADWNPHPEYQILIIYSHLFKNTDPLLRSPTLNYYFAQLQCTSHIHALFLSPLKKKKTPKPQHPTTLSWPHTQHQHFLPVFNINCLQFFFYSNRPLYLSFHQNCSSLPSNKSVFKNIPKCLI